MVIVAVEDAIDRLFTNVSNVAKVRKILMQYTPPGHHVKLDEMCSARQATGIVNYLETNGLLTKDLRFTIQNLAG
jgi:hypothetical protein